MKKIFILIFIGAGIALHAAPKKVSPLISIGANGALVYAADAQGNRVPDFSACGYFGSDREIPNAPVKVLVSPIHGDETARIQKAIDYVAQLTPDTNGIRGAILLQKGRHEISGELKIANAGVVLRGEGVDESGTVLVATGIDRRTLIQIAGQAEVVSRENTDWQITDDYVPVGATTFTLKNANELSVGSQICITRPSPKNWIDTLGMTEFGGGLGDWRLVWHAGSYDLNWFRGVEKIEGNRVTIDAPITTAMETNFGGGTVKLILSTKKIENVGVENLALESAFDEKNSKDENHAWFAITLENLANSWVREITFRHFIGSAVAVFESCQRVTVADCRSLSPVSELGGGRRNTFFTSGQQTLFLRCFSESGGHDFSVGFCAAGPNAFVQCEAKLPFADSGATESWASGTLFDNVRLDGGNLSLRNRGGNEQGAGWSAANSVFWNCTAAQIFCEQPPGAQNWALGVWGEYFGNGLWRHANESIKPDSLFAAQLTDRLGNDVANQRLAAKTIFTDAKNVTSLDEITDAKFKVKNPKRIISITNGWLVCDGKLLTGGTMGINWWRGNLRPSESKNYGVNLTRFAPGRVGAGFTDDLSAIADMMQSIHIAALDHHYGLWYDRRREDHERVRRVSAEVWPPFYEQPFARSGQAIAWDGLSKYDLTKYNPWYWLRLKQFADIGDARGLVLFNENYFQHNILEDGAHWVDSPWRSVNNINETGFHEPPFEIEKRTVMADQFYDVTNLVRRKLHEKFIRQNLDNFATNNNVVQFTSAEFTGPLAFEQFWLDTMAAWKHEHQGRHPLIALAATKDVQDAILADEKRSATVDVICFRYWWQTEKGLFAPNGGQNLSPRQLERQWKGGVPTDENLAAMTAEYRQKFPKKVIIASGEDVTLDHGAWAMVCAGGSLPNLPATTDAKLLAAIPQMQAWLADSEKSIWALRENGKQILIYASDQAEIDLTNETGVFQVFLVDSKTGALTVNGSVSAGVKVKLPDAKVIWLRKE